MKRSLGGRPLEMKFAFILVVTLLLPGVTSWTILRAPQDANEPNVEDLEDEHFLEPSSEGENLTEPYGTLRDHDIEAVSDISDTDTNISQEPPVVNDGTEINDEHEEEEDDALALFSLLVARAVDKEGREIVDDSEEDGPETNSVDEDKFSISDLPKLLKPLIDAFSDESDSEAPPKDDFLSWFPSLKDLFEPNKPSETEETNSATRSGRRSSFSAVSEPSLQVPPVSAQPSEPEILPSSQSDALISTVPTITKPPITITGPPIPSSKSPITIERPEDSDSDEDSETNF